MTTKEKADELVGKFELVERPFNKRSNLKIHMHKGHTVECALICVDEIIRNQKECDPSDQSYYYMGEQKYWQEVKEEINKLK